MRATLAALMLAFTACSTVAIEPEGTGHPLDGTIWDVANGTRIEPEALASRLDAADIAVLGEVHDNATHHRRQAWLVQRLAPAGIAFEMVPEASEEGIAVFREQGGTAGEIGPAIGWDRLGWPDWEIYEPVFEAAGGAYVAGGGVARDRLMAAMQGSAAAAFGTGASAYGLDRALEGPLQEDAEAEMVAAHCGHLPAEAAGSMVEAQRLRDARFAHATRRAAAIGGGQAVLITGNGHARTDRGVPAALAASDASLTILALGQVEIDPDATAFDDYAETGLPYDYVWFSARAERPDPCAQFR